MKFNWVGKKLKGSQSSARNGSAGVEAAEQFVADSPRRASSALQAIAHRDPIIFGD